MYNDSVLYEIRYDLDDRKGVMEQFRGNYDELDAYTDSLLQRGCRNIVESRVDPKVRREQEKFNEEERCVRSSIAGDYSPNCPWDAPGMSIGDLI